MGRLVAVLLASSLLLVVTPGALADDETESYVYVTGSAMPGDDSELCASCAGQDQDPKTCLDTDLSGVQPIGFLPDLPGDPTPNLNIGGVCTYTDAEPHMRITANDTRFDEPVLFEYEVYGFLYDSELCERGLAYGEATVQVHSSCNRVEVYPRPPAIQGVVTLSPVDE